MKLSTQKNSLATLVVLILSVAIYSAKILGDHVTKYQAYKTLQSITKLGKPIHSSVESLQYERLLTSSYLTHKDDIRYQASKDQFPITDKHLKAFAEQLKTTQILLLSIPESELEETRKNINFHRNALNRPENVFKENKSFYTFVISDFINFLDKMYEYADHPEFQPLIQSLILAEFYKEAISREITTVSHELSKPEIPEGEIPLIRQIISDEVLIQEKLFTSSDRDFIKTVNLIENSPEKKAMGELHKKFELKKPDLKGSEAESMNYVRTGLTYINRYMQLTGSILKKLEKMAKDGQEKLKEEMIKTSVIALIILIVLTGLFIFIQKIEAQE